MPKRPRLTGAEGQAIVLKAGFMSLRSKRSLRIYEKAGRRLVITIHSGVTLRPKTSKQVLEAIRERASAD